MSSLRLKTASHPCFYLNAMEKLQNSWGLEPRIFKTGAKLLVFFFFLKTFVCFPFPKILGLVLMVKVCSFFRKLLPYFLGIDFKIAGIRFGLELGEL